MKTRDLALCVAAACCAVGVTAADAAQAKKTISTAAAAPKAAPPPRPRSSMTSNLPEVDESKMPRALYVLPPVSKAYQPRRTQWGDPDLRGVWPIDSLGGLPLQRPEKMGERVFLSDEEYAAREQLMEQWRNAAKEEDQANKLGSGNWVEMTGAGRRTSMLISPKNGRLPPLTDAAKRLNAVGRSSWVAGQSFDWTTDFDSWDRCISRGFPASMLPFRYNNGIQIFQAPGYVIISLEMIHDARIIPLDGRAAPDPKVTRWMGFSRGHWEGNTLVIETSNIKRGAAPLNMATIGAPPNNTIPMSEQAHVTERLTMTGPNVITYEMTFSDPVYWTAPWTLRVDWQRNQKYGMFEYACHEGDEQIRNYIVTSRIQREKDRAKATQAQAAAPAAGGR